ncbi:FAD synthase [Tribolium castaneum]|nr:PREDICTED: FAD synthase [Tribolium castaneum]|eukprot:XP_008198295.1 PREDICTED: FAD synthase [Tribolium castaneum]
MALTTTSKLIRPSYHFRNMSSTQVKTAGILVIGDELLKGEVIDTNSPCITKEFHNIGVKVKKISVIGDEIDELSSEIRNFSKLYNYVITTGGIGPTHDDVTFEAVSRAFGIPLALNPQLRNLCQKFYNTTDDNHPGMKLAMVPESAKLTFSDQTNYPNVSVENVYMFPGIPELFRRSFLTLSSKLFKSDDTVFHCKALYVNLTEDKIADELGKLAADFPDVQVGSYPKLFHKLYKVKITMESTNENSVKAATDQLLAKFPKEAVVDVDNDSL